MTSFMRLGRIMQKLTPRVSTVDVMTNELDPYLSMYFTRREEIKVDDNGLDVMIGDDVIVARWPSAADSRLIDSAYYIQSVVHRVGFLIDPVTGKRVMPEFTGSKFYAEQQRQIGEAANFDAARHQATLRNKDKPEEIKQVPLDMTTAISD